MMPDTLKTFWSMFAGFFRIGVFSFGGGYSMLPMMQREIVEKNSWATEEELLDYYAVSQCIPGMIAVNTAVFVGCKNKGVPGAICCAFGVVLPSFLIITAIAAFITMFSEMEAAQHAFMGIRAAVCALIFKALLKLWKHGVKNRLGVLIFVTAFIVTAVFKVSPAYTVAAAGLVGVVFMRREFLTK